MAVVPKTLLASCLILNLTRGFKEDRLMRAINGMTLAAFDPLLPSLPSSPSSHRDPSTSAKGWPQAQSTRDRRQAILGWFKKGRF